MEKVTYKQIASFRMAAKQYIETVGDKQNKVSYACQKMLAKIENYFQDYVESERDLRSENGLIKDDIFVLDKRGGIEIDAKKTKEFNTAMRKLAEKEVEIEPYIATSVPKKFEISWYEYFIPFVFADYPEPVEEEFEKKEEDK